MAKVCTLEVNGDTVSAHRGDLLLDAALLNGIDLPHDCRSGHCGTCRVRVLEGRVFGGQTSDPNTVYACQCRILSDVKVAVEDVPEILQTAGVVTEMRQLASDVWEVAIDAQGDIEYIPGQYYSLQFRGFPPRCFSPTAPIEWPSEEGLLRFHIRMVKGGRVTPALGTRIRTGHKVKLEGPFGSAFLRPFPNKRLVMVGSGTGFAPIWSVTEAAIRANPRREMVLAVGARTLDALYMIPALVRLAPFPNVTIIPVVSEPQDVTQAVRCGRPTDFLPPLTPNDVVFACGAPAMVNAVAAMATAAGASCYSDPFEPMGAKGQENSLWSRAAEWLGGEARPSFEPKPESKSKSGPKREAKRESGSRQRHGTSRWDKADPHAARIRPQRARREAMSY